MSYTEQPTRAERDTAAWSMDTEREPSGPGVIDSPHQTDDTQGPARAPDDGQLQPGGTAADPVAALWGADLVRQYRGRWEELQLRFVDDPRAAAGQAAQLIDEAVESLTGALGA
ncbi:MAG TPA: hypothetical protein VFU35_15810, partial [Jatrophihabitans sp.]|nr:hypothetical protein [Jatrophihabitans sp.]